MMLDLCRRRWAALYKYDTNVFCLFVTYTDTCSYLVALKTTEQIFSHEVYHVYIRFIRFMIDYYLNLARSGGVNVIKVLYPVM